MEKLHVVKDLCIGCGACIANAEDVFDLDDNDGLAFVKEDFKNIKLTEELVEQIKVAIASCPTDAIKEK
jgi:ferredoxin